MSYKVSIQLEQTEDGYSAYSPDRAVGEFQADSLDLIFIKLKEAVKLYFKELESDNNNGKIGQSIWELADNFVKDLTEEELNQLPTDGAEQHDHYIYGTPKRTT